MKASLRILPCPPKNMLFTVSCVVIGTKGVQQQLYLDPRINLARKALGWGRVIWCVCISYVSQYIIF